MPGKPGIFQDLPYRQVRHIALHCTSQRQERAVHTVHQGDHPVMKFPGYHFERPCYCTPPGNEEMAPPCGSTCESVRVIRIIPEYLSFGEHLLCPQKALKMILMRIMFGYRLHFRREQHLHVCCTAYPSMKAALLSGLRPLSQRCGNHGTVQESRSA